MLRGMATTRLHAEDLEAAVAWYSKVLGIAPYYRNPYYVEFRIGDFQHELGIAREPGAVAEGIVTYWHVDDIDASHARLLELGATGHQPPTKYGEGFIAASVIDPFGNILGIMYNQHYLDVVTHLSPIVLPEVTPVHIAAVPDVPESGGKG